MKIVLLGDPRTKKNSQQMVMMGGKPRLLQSRAYREYRDDCLRQITGPMRKEIETAVNVKCVYYMRTKRRVDLVNLIEATLDILVEARVLADDNSRIATSHDGSRVEHDKQNPRVEIEITEMPDCATCGNWDDVDGCAIHGRKREVNGWHSCGEWSRYEDATL